MSGGELVGLAAAGALAVYAKAQGPKCPFHRVVLVLSSVAFVGDVFFILHTRGLLKKLGLGGECPKGGRGGRKGKSIVELVRKNILELEPYRCARDDYSEGILLDANENAFGPTLPADLHHMELERYPDPYQLELKQKIAKYRAVEPEQIFVGVGSDEAIDLIIRIFCVPGKDSIIITPPTYGMYKVCAKTNDVGIVSVPLTPTFDIRVPEILDAVTEETKIIFICSPGNPTAKLIPLNDISRVAKEASGSVVVVDEAYIDFSHASEDASACKLLKEHQNIIVLQTLSKAFGLAGIRCGMAIGDKEVIQIMNNVKAPYNVSKLTSNIAHTAFEHLDKLQTNISAVLKEKERVRRELEKLEYVKKIHHSDTNFILFEVPNAYNIYKAMAGAGVVARYRGSELHCNDCIRVTIGRPHENDKFLDAFKVQAQKLLAKYT